MSVRLIDPAPRHFNESGLPLDFGVLYSYRQFTNLALTTYADLETLAPNGPTVELSRYGITPNVFINSNYGFRLTDKYGTQLWSRDYIQVMPEQFENWSASITYRASDIVTASDGNYYQSLIDQNINNDPIESPSAWIVANFFEATDEQMERLNSIGATEPGSQVVLIGDGDSWNTQPLAQITRSYLAGLNIGVVDGVLSVSAGGAAATNVSQMLYLTSAITKDCFDPFVIGEGNGALATGAAAPSPAATGNVFGIFLVKIGNSIDILLDSDLSCANGIANNQVIQYRRIGYVAAASGEALNIMQHGDYFLLDFPVNGPSRFNPGTSAFTLTAGISPPNCIGILSGLLGSQSASNTELLVSDLASPDSIPSIANYTLRALASPSVLYRNVQTIMVRFNVSQQVRVRLSFSDANIVVQLNILGWIDTRGRNG